ncbi:hypothetical protein RhiirA4_450850 [Rhizophagus irregularis]|uniref:Uncharacterized protein n=1 Tax=Rhizophagus irregularis TaxID=588596 RepID=A0A2I1FU64_9GLOM|nr:hypothetical protein RhiirA4_450850 [Rhizophagus irregularis]
MNLDSRAQYKLVSIGYSDVNFKDYRRILEALYLLVENFRSGNINNTYYKKEAKINHFRLKFFSQPTSHSEKDKLALVSYNHNGNFMASYENYHVQSKVKDTMPSAPNFESACISITSGNQKKFFEQEGRPTPSPLLQKPIKLMGNLEKYLMQHSANASEFRRSKSEKLGINQSPIGHQSGSLLTFDPMIRKE